MRLLIFIHSLSSGGAERVTANLANAWAERGWTVTVVTLAGVELDFYTLHPAVRRIVLGLASDSGNLLQAAWANLRRLVALRRVLRESKPEVVLGMMNTAAVLAVLANIGLPGKVIVSERTHPPQSPLGLPWDWLRRRSYPVAARVAVLTDETRQWLQAQVPGCQVVVIPNAMPFPLPMTEPVLPLEPIGSGQRRMMLAVGRLVKLKGFDWLIAAFGALAADHPDWDLVILGEGPTRPALEVQITALGLKERVRLPGRAGNVADWYRRADLYVMSSRFEGFPNTLGEAMAHGCPAVSFDCDTGPRDIIREGVDGVLVRPVGDVQALAAALAQLMNDKALRQRMAEQAIEVRDRFSMARILGMWDQVFEEIGA